MIRWARAALVLTLAMAAPARADEWRWNLPPGIEPPPVPADNPMSAAKVALGRILFHDPRLSGDGTLSCASCHFERLAFTDGRPLSVGITGQNTQRNAPPLVNLGWLSTYTWANPALVTLERQMEVPLYATDPVEMGVTDANTDTVLARLRGDAELSRRFADAFPQAPEAVSFDTIIKAVAAFQRSLTAFDSAYDRGALSPAERRGRDMFSAACSACHGGPLFTDHTIGQPIRFHDAAIHGMAPSPYPNRGLFELTAIESDRNRFRAPPLRQVALTAPYMHDGSMADLETVLARFAGSPLSAADQADIVAFLRSLTSQR